MNQQTTSANTPADTATGSGIGIAELTRRSREIVTGGQGASGGYVASPTFSQYGFAWLRDGAYCALAMDAVGELDSSLRFHRWVAGVIAERRERVEQIVAALDAGMAVPERDMLPTRYRLDGTEEGEVDDGWPNFQLDGYGTWLFSLHSRFGDALPDELAEAARLAARYVEAAWRLPCYDYWEESGDHLHTSTLAALAAGLRGAARLLAEPAFDAAADEVVAFIRGACVADGAYVKGPDDARVDASLVSLRVPFGLVEADDPLYLRTIERIRTELVSPTGGIRRYLGDEYYGGSPWILLTAWLGWADRLAGDDAAYEASAEWIRARAGADGELPEQVVSEPQQPERLPVWERRWGPVASPLLWSHAKFLLLQFGPEATRWS